VLFKVEKYEESKDKGYTLVTKQLSALLEGEPNVIANLSNASALLNQFLDRTNWVGFYLYEEESNDVHAFPGHIACDAASQSEIVVPIVKDDKLIGVLDIDSPEKARFDEEDQHHLERFVEELVRHV